MASEIKGEQEFKIGHVLFIDIVGYSKFSIEEQREAVEKLSQLVRETEQFCAADETGQLVSLPTGDGMALVFSNTVEAPVQCALEIARKLKNHPELPTRMGIHSGPVSDVRDVNEQSNIAGAGINVAQRVMERGDAGHILLSKHVADDLEQYRNWRPHLHELGECEIKHGKKVELVNLYNLEVGNPEVPTNFRQPKDAQNAQTLQAKRASRTRILIAGLVIAAGAAIGGFYFFSHYSASTITIADKSIAVLPFENRSEDKANAYFADGMQDEILTRLAKIGDLKVISRTSTEHYRSAPENLPAIARELGVAHILEGSVQKIGETVRVNVQLINAATDSHLWAETFDRRLIDIFSVESEIAKAIADQLQARLNSREQQLIVSKPTDNPAAYDAYLRGLAYSFKPISTLANTISAQNSLKEAVQLDPKFALAWALLSYVDAVGYSSANIQRTAALKKETEEAARNALELDPNLGEALLAMGYFHYACEKDFDVAMEYFERAHRFLPNSSRIPESLAYVARRRGQWERSESYFREAERLDPRNIKLLTQHALLQIALRDFPEAKQTLDQILYIVPGEIDPVALKAAILQGEGNLTEASSLLDSLRPTADQIDAMEIQLYQAILTHRTADIIPRIKALLAKPNPALNYVNGELRFWLGWAEDVAGDHAAAREAWTAARDDLEIFLTGQPENHLLFCDLALVNMALGNKAAAVSLCQRAAVIAPVDKDAVSGPEPIEILVRVRARSGDTEQAIAGLQQLLRTPYIGAIARAPLTPALLKLDPMFQSLRSNPDFQKLVGEDN